jgi:F0F1-type ATP synthase assembly protein I
MQKRIFLYQLLTILILTGFGLLFEMIVAIMAFIGSAISTAGNVLFAKWIFADENNQHPNTNPNTMVNRFYLAELLKLVLTIAALTATLVLIKENPMVLLGAYLITQFFPTALASLQDNGTN